MNKILTGAGILIAIVVAAILVGPGMIDWNSYKADITEQAEHFTGRKLSIDGTIEISILPAPALIANDVRLANVDGASAADMVSLKSLQVRVALGPLLSGQIKVQTVHLVDPVIELESFANGRTNLEFAVGGGDVAAEQPESTKEALPETPTTQAGEGGFSLDNFVVQNATVIYRDAKAGSIERIEKFNATFAAASLDGPFESTGNLFARGVPLEYTVSVGKIIEQRTAPLSLTIGLQPGDTKSTLSGAIIGLNEVPTFKGFLKSTGKNLASLIQSLGPKGRLPGLLGQTFALEGEVEASASELKVANMSVSLGNTTATGSGALKLEENIVVDLELGVDSIDVDKWMAIPEIKKVVVPAPQSKQVMTEGAEPKTTVSLEMPAKISESAADPMAGGLPKNIEATLKFNADSLTLKGGLIRQARLSAELSGGEIVINQISALLPGSADVALFGFVVADEGQPRFEGDLEVSVGDLRGVTGWLGAPPPPVPSDRLRKMTLAAKLTANAKAITASDLDVLFDSSRLTGKAVIRLGQRMGIDTDLTLDRINLDAYLVPGAAISTPPPPPKIPETPTATAEAKAKKAESMGGIAAISALNEFDANLKGRIQTLVYEGAQIKNVKLDGSVQNGAINVRNISIDKLAGSTFKASGLIKNLDGIPQLDNVRLDAKAADVSRLLRLAGIESPLDSRKLGMLTFAGQVDGSALNPDMGFSLKGAGTSIALVGKASFLPVVGGFEGKLKVVHGNIVQMLRSLGVDYRPGGKLGGLNLESQIKADLSGLTLNELAGQVGPVKMNGAAKVSISGPRTKISADLNTDRIVADVFLPASKGAFRIDPAGPVAAAFIGPRAPAGKSAFKRLVAFATSRWPTDPIDLSVLKSFDADIKVKSRALVFGNYQLDNADVAATVDDGVLQLEKLNGGLFGGAIAATANIRAASPSTVETAISLKNLDVARGLMAVIGETPAGGRAGMDVNLKTSGFTVADLVAALGGRGAIALKGLDVAKTGKGTALSSVLGLVAGLNNLGGVLSGKKAGAGLADVTGSFNINKGIATSNDLALLSSMGTGQARGSVDLSRWLIDVAGQVEMSQNFLGLILNQGQATPSLLPFSIKGNLDAPNVKLDTSKLQGAGLPIPGLDKVLKKKGLGNILQQIIPGLGGSTGSQPTSPPPSTSTGNTPPPPPPPPSSEPQKLKPQDLLKGLLKGLGG
ncbi:MAG: AsmA family protein [Rhodospirillaceae bacterium]|nr:AsmA family protein [Rhodospirillaceae bacterium]MBT5245200.1 AsmA family protein [Rhodospirillaceae bacterium]MBT5561926.1 AsmA family protein [Rhodospirillaceae bacterium]MBT6241956.1 AsmA family protein [Rhodospirillaceae bacterium]MBT7138590.1 AsmA family protein [Rhodospirillaceae bacterium]